jgi:hypothetical protein
MTNRSAPTFSDNSSLARSLSMTASTPDSSPAAVEERMVGMPPPPAQTTSDPRSSSHEIGSISMICCGSGEGTTRRQAAPSCRNTHALSLASASASAWE